MPSLPASRTLTSLLFNGGLLLLEWAGSDALKACAIGRKKNEIPTPQLVRQLLVEGLINHFVTGPLVAYYLLFPAAKYFGAPDATDPLPPLTLQLLLFAAAHSFNDWTFYFSHRLMHSRLLYARFHKQHHTFRGSIGAAAEFAGPTEQIVSNNFPTLGGLLLVGAHPLIQLVWVFMRLTQTYEVHSGYDFSHTWLKRVGLLTGGSTFHDHHHTVNCGSFGAVHMDWLFGTMDHYVRDGGHDGYLAKRAGLERAGLPSLRAAPKSKEALKKEA